MNNDQIINKIWQSKKYGEVITDIHSFCAKITDAIIKYSMEKNSVQYLTVSLDYWLTNQRIAQSLFRWYAGAGSCLSVSLRNNPGLCTVGLRAVIGTEFFPVTQMGIFLQAIAQPQLTFGSELRFSFCIPVEAGVRFWF